MARGNSFEGSSDETTVTSGNSGGSSGNAFDSVSVGTGATVVYDNAQAALGSFSCRMGTTGTSSLAYVSWTLASVTTDYSRGYLRLTSLPSAAAQPVLRYLSGGSQSFRVNVKSAGTIEVRDAGNSVVGTTTAAISAGQFWRMEIRTVLSATVGQVELRYFASPNGTTPTETLNLSGLTLTANATEIRWGVGAALANAVSAWFDNVATEGSTWLGPATGSGTADQPTTLSTSVVGTRTVLGATNRPTNFAGSAAGSRTVLGTASRATAFDTAAIGARITFGLAVRETTFGTTATGQRVVLGTVTRATAFAAPAVGQVVVFDSTPGVLTASTPTAALAAAGSRSSLNATTPATAALAATTSP